MNTTSDKYKKVMVSLKRSAPRLDGYSDLEDSILERISQNKAKAKTGIVELLFSWIYIRWIRESMVIASLAILGFFIWQQHILIDQINDLRRQINDNGRVVVYNPSLSVEKQKMLMKLTKERTEGYYLTEEEITEILDSVNQLNIRYNDLIELLDDEPGLKKIVEDKLDKKFISRLKKKL